MIYLIAGNSGSGKTTQANILRDNLGFYKIITYTTRAPRLGEINGLDYKFIDKETFFKLKDNDQLVAITEYSNNFYAIDKKELSVFSDTDKNLVMVLDLEGVKEIKSKFKNVVCIYLTLDEETLVTRMITRGDSLEKITNRKETMQDFTPYADYIIDSSQKVSAVSEEILKIVNNKKGSAEE